jgi:hypothetical protein
VLAEMRTDGDGSRSVCVCVCVSRHSLYIGIHRSSSPFRARCHRAACDRFAWSLGSAPLHFRATISLTCHMSVTCFRERCEFGFALDRTTKNKTSREELRNGLRGTRGLALVRLSNSGESLVTFLGVFFLLAAQEGETLANQDERDLKGDELFRPARKASVSIAAIAVPGSPDHGDGAETHNDDDPL